MKEALQEHGDAVIAVVATSGTTNFGTIDDIAGIVRTLKEEFDFWLHIDGAYGLAAMLSPQARHKFAGVEEADSLIVDTHKWLFAPFDACALIYRDPNSGRRAHTQKASTSTRSPTPRSGAVGFRHPTDQTTSRTAAVVFRGQLYGVEAYREAIGHSIDLARQIATEIRQQERASGARTRTLP